MKKTMETVDLDPSPRERDTGVVRGTFSGEEDYVVVVAPSAYAALASGFLALPWREESGQISKERALPEWKEGTLTGDDLREAMDSISPMVEEVRVSPRRGDRASEQSNPSA